jgi:hypothetical protein
MRTRYNFKRENLDFMKYGKNIKYRAMYIQKKEEINSSISGIR